MVQVLPYVPSFGNRLGAVLGDALGEVGSAYVKNSVLENELGQLQSATNPKDLATSLVRLSSRIPGSERYIAPLYQTMLSQIQTNNSLGAPLAGEQGQNSQVEQTPIQIASKIGSSGNKNSRTTPTQARNRSNLINEVNGVINPSQKAGSDRFFPNNLGYQEDVGNIPQQATGGQAVPVLSPSELNKQARDLAIEKTKKGIPTTPQDALKEVTQLNEANKLYNQTIEQERQERVATQRDYGSIGKGILEKLYPEATDEQKAIFSKMAENAAYENKSEADIERLLSKEASKFKNTIANIRQDLSAPRLQNSIQRRLLGTEKDFNEAISDLKLKVKPLLDLGLYDTARKELSSIGYYPEEVESIVNPLDQRTLSIIRNSPSAKKIITKKPTVGIGVGIPTGPSITESYDEKSKENLKSSLEEILKNNPNSSLGLIRKSFEDKNYDWRLFKNSLNELIEEEKISLNDDQINQIKYLDSPPLNLLDKLLHNLKIIGR